MKIYNMTEHNIDIYDNEYGSILLRTIEPSGVVIRATMHETEAKPLDGGFIPVWKVWTDEPYSEGSTHRVGDKWVEETDEYAHIIVSKIAADALLKHHSNSVIWYCLPPSVNLVHVYTVHKTQINKATGERYGALGLALQGNLVHDMRIAHGKAKEE